MKKWTIEKCKLVASQCETKKDFKLKYPHQFKASYRNGWLDIICKHMKKIGNKYQRLIYCFEFSDKSVYVGLTYNPNKRKQSHLTEPESQVYKHIQKTGLQPEFKILTEYLEKDLATIKEGEYVLDYKNKDWLILNKKRTGGLGSNTRIWTFENCKNVAKKCKYRVEFKKQYSSAYYAACKNKWLKEICSHMIYLQKPNWNFDTCKLEALKYKTKYNFIKNSLGAYLKAQRNKWLKDICKHMI